MRSSILFLVLSLFSNVIFWSVLHAGPAPSGSPRRLLDGSAVATLPTVVASPLRLNEFLAGPARDWDGDGVLSTRDDEWVEIINTGGSTLDLSSFYFTDGDS
ncbi:MAG: hypothetical protein ACRDL7_08035, partial [Gaiellaceae bacterium]